MNDPSLDHKYLLLCAHRLRNFKRKSNSTFNMSCPFCGDSKSNKRKARGYIFQQKGSWLYHCHNCGITKDIPKLIQYLDPSLYDEYIRERFVVTTPKLVIDTYHFQAPKFTSVEQLKDLQKVSTLREQHPVVQWVNGRKIPIEQHKRLYFTKTFMQWTNTLLPNKFDIKGLKNDEPRLVIPLIDDNRNLLGFQGRSFKKNSALRYITIMLDDNHPKLFGWDCVDTTKPIYVVEGPIDSLFLPNTVASAGADLISNLHHIHSDISKFIIVFDREPRNKDIGKHVEKAIKRGYNVALLPETMPGKDINEYVLSGMSREKIIEQINKHVFSGLEATLAFQKWKRY